MPATDHAARRSAFRTLHQSGCFVIPNPWDTGSARYLRHLGFKALATTSAGYAFACGVPDAAVSRDSMLGNIREIVAAVELPVNADFENGYAHDPEDVARNVRLCVETGVAGLSIEDATGDPEKPLYELPLAVERIKAARAAIDATGGQVLLTARAECYLVGHPQPFPEAMRRLEAFAAAGADVLYAPGVVQREEIKTMASTLSPKPVNLLMSRNTGLRVADAAELGVRRISVGSSLSRAAWTAFLHAAELIAKDGSFAGFDALIPYAEINGFFRDDRKQRSS
jgi:2-methylisocitrate lyase-like PEP mutase family enzyme